MIKMNKKKTVLKATKGQIITLAVLAGLFAFFMKDVGAFGWWVIAGTAGTLGVALYAASLMYNMDDDDNGMAWLYAEHGTSNGGLDHHLYHSGDKSLDHTGLNNKF